jgi:RNA recognition motif-containing protein
MSAEQQPKTEASTEIASSPAVVDEYPHKVFVGNIAFTTIEDDLRKFFSPVGTV